MSRLSKYVKEKIVKVLVAALVVGTVAGNGTLTVQAEEAATVVGEESVSGGDAVVEESNVEADSEVTEVAAGAGIIMPLALNLNTETSETVNLITVGTLNYEEFAVVAQEYTGGHLEGGGLVANLRNCVDFYRPSVNYIGQISEAMLTVGNGGYDGKASLVIEMPANTDKTFVPKYNDNNGGNVNLVVKETGKEDFWFTVGTISNTEPISVCETGAVSTAVDNALAQAVADSQNYYNMTSSETVTVINVEGRLTETEVATVLKDAQEGKIVIINCLGNWTNIDCANMAADGGYAHQGWAANIIWNLGQSSGNLVLNQSVFGRILAPNADFSNGWAVVVGSVVAKTFVQGNEVHYPGLKGEPRPVKTPTPTVTPTPTPTVTPLLTTTRHRLRVPRIPLRPRMILGLLTIPVPRTILQIPVPLWTQ